MDTKLNLSRETIAAQTAVKKAGKVLMEFYESKNVKISEKEGGSPVTEADYASERVIINILSKRFPTYGIISEEAGEEKKKSDSRWIVDPLDGTRNFACGNPLFCTMVALQFRHEILSAAVFVPYTNDIYIAEKNRGAFLNGKRIHVSERNSLNRFLFDCVGVPLLSKREASKTIQNLLRNFGKNLRISGCAGIAGCFAAAGRLDGAVMYELGIHDMAAPYLLVKEAGGIVTDIKGKPWKQSSNSVLASNGKIHGKLVSILK